MQRVAHSNLLPTLGRGSRARLLRPLNSRVPSVSGRARFTTAPSVTPAVPFRTHIGPLPSATSHALTPNAHVFWHAPTSTWTYVVVCPTTNHCVIIDPALDYDPATETVSTETADALVAFIHARAYTVDKILESHAHADHLTAARYLQLKLSREQPGVKVEVGIGEKITQTQDYFASKYDVKPDELRGAFDKLWKDGETFKVGHCEATVMHLPGHTVRLLFAIPSRISTNANDRSRRVTDPGGSRRVPIRLVCFCRRFNLSRELTLFTRGSKYC